MEIKDISLFCGNDKNFYKKASDNLILNRCKSKFVFFNEGDVNNFEAYILKSGIVILSKTNRFGFETSVDVRYAGEIFGWTTLLDNIPRTAKITALVDCEYWRIPKSLFNYLIENKVFTQNLLKYYSNYIRINENFITFSNSGAVIDKVLFQLLRIGVMNKKQDKSIIHNKFSQAIIASFAGVSRETVSRTVKILKEKKILEFDNCKNIHINVLLANRFLESSRK